MAIVLDYPTALEAKKGTLLEGDTGRLVKATLKALGVALEDIHVLTALNCKLDTSKPKLMRESMACCRARLLRELRSYGIEKVLCLGTIGYTALCPPRVYNKKGQPVDKIARMDKVHGRWMNAYGMKVIATYSPTRVLIDVELYRDFTVSFVKFFTTNGREAWPDIDLTIADSWKQARKWLNEHYGEELSLDIETDGFSPITNKLLAVGLGYIAPNGKSGEVLVLTEKCLQQDETWIAIADQLEYGTTGFHNGKFDLKFIIRELRKRRISYKFGYIDDTMLLNYCRDERPWGKYGAHSLKNISRVRYDAPDYDIGMGAWIKEYNDPQTTDERRQEMLDELYTYLALDCYYTARLQKDLRQEVQSESKKLLDFYEWLLIPGMLALMDIEYRGCKIDRPYLEDMDIELEEKAQRLLKKIRLYVGNPEFNPQSSQQMYAFLYVELGLPVPKTERKGRLQEGPTSRPMLDILRHKVPEHTEFLQMVIDYRRAKKIQGTYINGLLSRLDPDDRIRGDYQEHGTSTGRLSSSNPNLQNIPDKSYTGVDLRAAYIPSGPDWVIVETDYSQLELRVAAYLSGDEKLTQVYIEDGDLHDDVSEAVYHRRETSPHERWLIKRLVFGTLYGRGAASLATGPEMEYVESELKQPRWTLEETEVFFERFMAAYPKLRKWQVKQAALGYRNQYVETPLGRRRRFPLIGQKDNGTVGRQSMNTPIQSTASDITFSALIRIHERLTELNNRVNRIVAHIVLTVHDSITVECHKKYLRVVKKIIQEETERVPLESQVPFKAKIKVGPNWGACE